RVALLAQVCATLSTGGRGPFILLFVSLFLGFGLMGRIRQALAGGFLLVVFFGASAMFLGPVVQARFASIFDLEMIRDRNTALAMGEFNESMESPIVGLGAGIGCAAANRLDPNLAVVGSENQFARIRNEGGLAGLALFLVLTTAMLAGTWNATRLLVDPD